MTNGIKMKNIISIFLVVFLFFSCTSAPKNIPEDLTASELTVKAQESIDKGHRKAALAYYQAILDRYQYDASIRIAAEFEIAHIKIKQKNWDEAETMLLSILEEFKSDSSMSLPQEYRKLALIDLEKIQKR